MIKYIGTALCLKFFSINPTLRSLYRRLGNRFGGRKRRFGTMPGYYSERLKRMLRLNRQFGIVAPGDRILEVGTGWLHWEALSLRLFCDVNAVLFDVWDNRQLPALKNYLRQFGEGLEGSIGLSASQAAEVRRKIDEVLAVESFDQLYALLGFTYVVEPTGSLAQFPSESFQLVVSGAVLEHVSREAIPSLIKESYRILKPGGWAVHSIDTSDHLSHYDPSVNKKRYVGYSEGMWRWVCDNEVQGINRLQKGEWLEMFRQAGFEMVEEEYREVDISRLKIAPRFAAMNPKDLATTTVRLTMRKPARA